MFEMDENRILIDPLEIDSIPFHNNHFQCSDEENLNKTFIKFESDGASLFTRFFIFTFHNSLIFLFLLNPPPHLDIAVLRRNSGLKLKLSFNDAVNNIASCLVSGLNN